MILHLVFDSRYYDIECLQFLSRTPQRFYQIGISNVVDNNRSPSASQRSVCANKYLAHYTYISALFSIYMYRGAYFHDIHISLTDESRDYCVYSEGTLQSRDVPFERTMRVI